MDLQLAGKRALITGSSGGIGAGIARILAQEGVYVAIHGRDEARAAQIAGEITEQGGKASLAIGDLATDEGAERVAQAAMTTLGGVDMVINNVGIYVNHGWLEATPEDWARLYNANVLSTVRLIRLLVPQMKESRWGRIIQVASGEAVAPFAFMPDYAATKAAMVNLTVSLAKDLSATGITVNTVSPGIIVTEPLKQFYHEMAATHGWGTEWAEIERAVLREIWPNLVGRLGNIEDVAFLVAFLVSPRADFITGANYRVEGGSIGTVN